MENRPFDSADLDDMFEFGELPFEHLKKLRTTVEALDKAENELSEAVDEINLLKKDLEEFEIKRATCCVQMERDLAKLKEAVKKLFSNEIHEYEGRLDGNLTAPLDQFNEIKKML